MSRSQLEKISIAEIPDSGTTFDYYNTFSVVQEGSDEASRQVLSIEPASSPVIEDGQTLITSKNYDLTVSGLFKSSTISGLQSLADDRDDVVFGGFGLGGQILQMDGKLNLGQVFTETASFRFNSPREAKGGYDSSTGKHTSELCYSYNGLAMYKWQEGSTSGLGAGWVKSTNGVASWDTPNNEQDFETSAAGGATLHRDLFLPFDGLRTIYFNVNFTAVADTSPADTVLLKIQSFSDYGSTQDVTEASLTVTTAGDKQVSITPSSSSKMIRVIVAIGNGDIISFKNPTVQLDSTYNFVEFNT